MILLAGYLLGSWWRRWFGRYLRQRALDAVYDEWRRWYG